MPKIIAYTYESDYHCRDCAGARFPAPIQLKNKRDECGVYTMAVDIEGNPLHPVFDINEIPAGISCADCHCEITKPLRKFRVRVRRLVIEHYDLMARDSGDACARWDSDGVFSFLDDSNTGRVMDASEVKAPFSVVKGAGNGQ